MKRVLFAFSGILLTALLGCGGGTPYSPQSVAVSGQATPPPSTGGGIEQPDFGLALTAPDTATFPADIPLMAKVLGTATYTQSVALTSQGSDIALSVASATPSVAGTPVAATYRFPALERADIGDTVNFVVSGTSGGAKKSASALTKIATFKMTLMENQPFDNRSRIRSFTLSLGSVNGFAGTLALRPILTSLPADAKLIGLPATATLTADSAAQTFPLTLQLTTLPTVFNQSFQVAGGIGGKERTATGSFGFQAAIGYQITYAPKTTVGLTQTFDVTIAPTGGFSGQLKNLGFSLFFDPNSAFLAAPQGTTVTGLPGTVNFGASQAPQTFTITVTLPPGTTQPSSASGFQVYLSDFVVDGNGVYVDLSLGGTTGVG